MGNCHKKVFTMCGLNFSKHSDVKAMNLSIQHRGLERRSSVLNKDGLSFGHVRLPIQGLSTEFDQPYEYKNLIILFVGEIYNYKELNSSAKSDVQVFAEMWDCNGEKCLDKFDGMWSAVVYDKSTKVTKVITDYLAKKPLYIHPESLSVSSEIKSLCFNIENCTIDELYFSRIGKWGYCSSDRTFVNEIKKVPPGTIVTIENNRVSGLHKWVSLEQKEKNIKLEIEKSVVNRLTSDVPIGLLLSGGIDSSIIFKLMLKKTKDFTIFHIENNESDFLNYLNIPGEIKVKKLVTEDGELEDILFFNESPVDLGSMLSQYNLATAISKQNLNVTISGDGADELFGGYRRSLEYDSQYSDIFDELVFYHLPRLDKLMMAKTIELRSPFLSRGVIEGALDLPYESRKNKVWLREAFSDILPKEIFTRDKVPLKSAQVVNNSLQWRYSLIDVFKEKIIPRYFI